MKVAVKWVLYLFAGYYFIVGLIALITPSLGAALYSATSLSPEAYMVVRWVGALAIAIAYGTVSFIQSGNKEIARILIISAVATMFASLLGLRGGEATLSNIWFDFVFQVALVAALVAAGNQHWMKA